MTTRILSKQLSPGSLVVTEPLGDAVGFYIVAPDVPYEVELSIYLNVEISSTENRQIKLNDNLNLIDTETVLYLPDELRDIPETKRLIIKSNLNIIIEVWVFTAENVTSIANDILNKIELVLDEILAIKSDQQTTNVNPVLASNGVIDYPQNSDESDEAKQLAQIYSLLGIT